MVGRQLPRRRGPDPGDPRGSAGGLLPAAAEAGRRAARRVSAGLRPGLGVRRPRRQPLRPGAAAPIRRRLPARSAADDRRALGGRDHAAHRPRREPAPRGGADRARPRSARASGPGGGPAARGRRPRRRAGRRSAARVRTGATAAHVRGSARAAPAGPGSARHSSAAVARRAPGGSGNDGGRDRAARAPATGRDERDGPQRDHERAHDLRGRLGGALRERQPRRRRAPRGERLRADGLPDARPLSRCDRRARARLRPHRARSRALRPPSGEDGRHRSRARPRLLPDRGRTPALRGLARLPRAPAHLDGSDQLCGGNPRLPGQPCADHCAHPQLGVAADRRAARRLAAGRVRAARPAPGARRGSRTGESRRDEPPQRAGPPRSRAPRGRARQSSHRPGRPYAPHCARGDRGADRAARDPSPRESGRRALLRSALGLDRRRRRELRGRRRAPGGRERRNRALEPPLRSGSRGRALPLVPPAPGLERTTGKVDRLGAQARQAARVQSTAARCDRHDFHRRRRPGSRRTFRRPLRDHARRRHAAAARGRPQAGREDGAPAQSAALRSGRRARGRGSRGSAAASHSPASDRSRGLAVPAHVLEPERDRPLLRGGLGRVSGSAGRGLVRRKGNLRRRRLRTGARGPRAGERTAQPRPVRGDLRARRSGLGHRGRRGVPGALRRRRCPPSPLGARRLAAAPLAAGARRPDPAERSLEDARQPAAHPVRARELSRSAGRLDAALPRGARVEQLRPRGPCPSAAGAGARRHRAATRRNRAARPLPRAAGGRVARRLSDGALGRAPPAPDLADDRRHRAHAAAALRDSPPPPRVDDRGAGSARVDARSSPLLRAHGRRRRARVRRRRRRLAGRARDAPARRAVRDAVARRARARALDQPVSADGRPPRGLARRRPPVAVGRAPDLALLRGLRHREGSLAATGQLPGGPQAGTRAPHVADQPGPVPALGRQRARLRLDRNARAGRSAGGDARDDAHASSAIAGTSTTGTTRRTCARSTRSTCPRSTAATWPDICWHSRTPVARRSTCRWRAASSSRESKTRRADARIVAGSARRPPQSDGHPPRAPGCARRRRRLSARAAPLDRGVHAAPGRARVARGHSDRHGPNDRRGTRQRSQRGAARVGRGHPAHDRKPASGPRCHFRERCARARAAAHRARSRARGR